MGRWFTVTGPTKNPKGALKDALQMNSVMAFVDGKIVYE
jgi:hypothetical protein